MKMKMLSVIIAFFMLLESCATTVETTAIKRQTEISIDGQLQDWDGKLSPTNRFDTQLGFQFDDEFLYLCLVVPDRTHQMQMMVAGFSVWFDPSGGKNRRFGIRCPIGHQEDIRLVRSFGNDREARSFLDRIQSELSVTLEGGEPTQLNILETKEIQIRLAQSALGLVYELRVPLRRSAQHPYAIGFDSSASLGVGVQSYEILSQSVGAGQSSRPTGGGRGGRGGGSGALSGGVDTPDRPKMLDIWTRVSFPK